MLTRSVDRLLGNHDQLGAERLGTGAKDRAMRRQIPRMASQLPTPPQVSDTAATATTASGAAPVTISDDPIAIAAMPPATGTPRTRSLQPDFAACDVEQLADPVARQLAVDPALVLERRGRTEHTRAGRAEPGVELGRRGRDVRRRDADLRCHLLDLDSCLTGCCDIDGIAHRRTARAVLGAVPPVTVVVHLVNLRRFTVAHAKERRHTSVRTDRDARIDGLDMARFGKDLELHDSLGHRFTVRASTRRNAAPRFASN